MGCISSTKKLGDIKSENVFRAVQIHSELTEQARTGLLELTPRELIFRTRSNHRFAWALQHLRRYGLNGDVFSVEAGRRCMTGPGIYRFRCQRAEQLYHLFQSYINAVSLITDEPFAFTERERDHPSHVVGRIENIQTNTNNYLEPAPMVGAGVGLSLSHRSRVLRNSISSSPLSLDSPDSVPSLSFSTNEVVHFQSPGFPSGRDIYLNTPNTANAVNNTNIYSEHPLTGQIEHNNNLPNASSSAFSTLNRRHFVKHSSLDIPPEEFAPILTPPSEALHMYANVESGSLFSSKFSFQGVGGMRNFIRDQERCYENLNRDDVNYLFSPQCVPSTMAGRDVNDIDMVKQQQMNQTKSLAYNAVNYIVLDLNQPRSPTQLSPKLHTDSALSLVALDGNEESPEALSKIDVSTEASQNTGTISTTTLPTSTTKLISENSEHTEKKEETSLGYSTIDFIKTCALIKSSTHGADFDAEHGNEECRITRHSKCVRKAYSISE
ncbi:uncharacterized protein [Eurosta solidaginis]|uniref:uncharacterized protein n=1 Tax=Eurosta solidaginis TaxID=178769 RepID=UPI003530BFC9